MGSASGYIALARKEIGVTEQPPGSNRTPYGVTYGWNGVYWCAIFLCAMAMHYGLRKNTDYPFTASVFQARAWAKKAGKWSSTPHVGDWVVFTYSHIEVVTAVEGSRIKCLGGNTSLTPGVRDRDGGGVWEHWRPRNSSVSGYIRVNYGAGTGSTGKHVAPTKQESKGIFGMGKSKSMGSSVSVALKNGTWKAVPFAKGKYSLASANGQTIDILSEWVVNKDLPKGSDIQVRYYVIEYHDWSKDKHNYRSGDHGENVKVLQRFLKKATGHKLTIDGSLGPATVKVLKAFQKKKGLLDDGVAGNATKAKLSNGRRIKSYGAHEVTGTGGATFKSTQFRRTIAKSGQDRRVRCEAIAYQTGVKITRQHHEKLQG